MSWVVRCWSGQGVSGCPWHRPSEHSLTSPPRLTFYSYTAEFGCNTHHAASPSLSGDPLVGGSGPVPHLLQDEAGGSQNPPCPLGRNSGCHCLASGCSSPGCSSPWLAADGGADLLPLPSQNSPHRIILVELGDLVHQCEVNASPTAP